MNKSSIIYTVFSLVSIYSIVKVWLNINACAYNSVKYHLYDVLDEFDLLRDYLDECEEEEEEEEEKTD